MSLPLHKFILPPCCCYRLQEIIEHDRGVTSDKHLVKDGIKNQIKQQQIMSCRKVNLYKIFTQQEKNTSCLKFILLVQAKRNLVAYSRILSINARNLRQCLRFNLNFPQITKQIFSRKCHKLRQFLHNLRHHSTASTMLDFK